MSYFEKYNLVLFWWYWFHSGTLYENPDVVLIVVELLLKNFSSHFVLVPTKRRFDLRAFFSSYSSEKVD